MSGSLELSPDVVTPDAESSNPSQESPADGGPAPLTPPATEAQADPAAPRPGLLRRAYGHVAHAAEFAFGLVALVIGLSVLAAVPIVQFVSLGWLLEAEGRVARSGRLRDGFPGVRRVARIGSALIGLLLFGLPLLLLRSLHQDATLLDPTGPAKQGLEAALTVLSIPLGAQALLAIGRGGRLRYFFQPLGNLTWLARTTHKGNGLRSAAQSVRAFVGSLRLPHYLALGTQGFVAAFLWLALPSLLLVGTQRAPGLILLAVPALAVTFPLLIVAQARLAAEGRFRAAFELGAIWRRLRRAPIALLLALILVLGLALPLYLFKLEPLPRDARWLPALFFVSLLLPGRLVAGWAYARGSREGKAHWLLFGPVALSLLPLGAAFVFFQFLSQFFTWSGAGGVLAHHAFLLPVAFY